MIKSPTDRILMFLKMQGAASSSHIAEELSISKEGARKQLVKLAEDGLIDSQLKNEGVGRPSTYYALTDKGLKKFPDTHAEVTVELLKSVRKLLGDNALDLLISDREQLTYDRYQSVLASANSLEAKLELLTDLRSQEGYMAEWKKEADTYTLIENHCPICAAATECQGFCRSELQNFKQLIGSEYEVQRVQHIVSGGQRCIYEIKKTSK